MSKLRYLARSVVKLASEERRACPNCGSASSMVVERKWVVTSLRRCSRCLMMFRSPTDDPEQARKYYNESYEGGFATDCPSDEELERLKASNWSGGVNYDHHIGVLRALGAGKKLFDFGCTWGYGSYQLAQAGFDVTSYEISVPRARYASEKLGVQVVGDFEGWIEQHPSSLDVFFSSHVLEHVPSPSRVISLARRALKPGGLFVAAVPNGAAASRGAQADWSKLWGEVHPNYLDDVFLNAAVNDRPRMFGSSPIDLPDAQIPLAPEGRCAPAFYVGDLTGDELIFAFRN